MNLSELQNEIRYITRTTSLDFTDTDITSGLNQDYAEIINTIIQISGNYHVSENKATTDLVANATSGQIGYNGHYCFPSDMLALRKIEISYDGSKYKKATYYDMTQGVEQDMDTGTTSNPVVRVERKQLVVRPLPETTITDGIIIWYDARQADLSNLTDEPLFEKNFHYLLVLKGALRYAMRFPEKYNELWDKRAYGLQKDLEKFYREMYKTTKVVSPEYEDFSI